MVSECLAYALEQNLGLHDAETVFLFFGTWPVFSAIQRDGLFYVSMDRLNMRKIMHF